jgi:hypothetical protein
MILPITRIRQEGNSLDRGEFARGIRSTSPEFGEFALRHPN